MVSLFKDYSIFKVELQTDSVSSTKLNQDQWVIIELIIFSLSFVFCYLPSQLNNHHIRFLLSWQYRPIYPNWICIQIFLKWNYYIFHSPLIQLLCKRRNFVNYSQCSIAWPCTTWLSHYPCIRGIFPLSMTCTIRNKGRNKQLNFYLRQFPFDLLIPYFWLFLVSSIIVNGRGRSRREDSTNHFPQN